MLYTEVKMLKAVIFDMDGVLIDSEPFHLVVNEKIFANLGINLSEDEYHGFIGTTHQDMWSTIKKRYNLPQSVPELVDMQVSGNINYIKEEEIEPIKIKGVGGLLSEIAQSSGTNAKKITQSISRGGNVIANSIPVVTAQPKFARNFLESLIV